MIVTEPRLLKAYLDITLGPHIVWKCGICTACKEQFIVLNNHLDVPYCISCLEIPKEFLEEITNELPNVDRKSEM